MLQTHSQGFKKMGAGQGDPLVDIENWVAA